MSQQSKKNAEHMEWEQQEGDGGNNRGSKGIVEEGGKWGDGLEPEEQDVLEAAEKSRKSAATLGDGNSTQVSLRERKKLVLAFAEFVGSGEKLMEDMREQIYRYTKVTARVRDVVLKPVQQFVEQLAKRHRELDSGKWERIVMRMMRDHGIENFSELQAAISGAGRKERVADEEVEKSDNEWKFLQENWERQNDKLRQRLEKARAEAENLQLQLDAVQIEKEGCEKEVERLERSWKLERKTAKELRQMMEQSTGKEKRDQERSKLVIQERYRRPGTQSVDSRGSSSAWPEPESQKRGEAKRNGIMGRREIESEDGWRKKVEDWDFTSGDYVGMPRDSMGRERESVKLKETSGARKGKSETGSSVSKGSSSKMIQCLNKLMRANVLPEPAVFDKKGEVKEFKRSFLLKYRHVTERDEDLLAILEDKFLKGAARTLFKSLPKRFERPIEELFKEFAEKLKRRQGDREAEAYNEFEDLRRRPRQRMWEYCIEVEKWSRIAFPEMDEETLSQLRVTKLMKALRDDQMMQKLMNMKRHEVPKREQYEFIKDIVLQQENEDNRRQGFRKADRPAKSEWQGKKKSA